MEAEANSDGGRIAELLRTQVTAPVRFTEMVQQMKTLGVEQFLEIGPGRVLSGLIARIDRRSKRAGLSTLEDLEAAKNFVDGEPA